MIENIKAIQKTIQSTSIILKQMMNSGEFNNNNDAFVVLRACLKSLRDRLETGEAFHLGSQLPALLRGYYYEGWKPSSTPKKIRNKEDFLADIQFHLNGHEELKLEKVVPIGMKCILDFIDQGEAVEVLHNLPKEIRELFP